MKKIIAIPLLLTILGCICYLLQLIYGARLTNLHNFLPWGLYVVGYMIFTGIAAGSLLFIGLSWLTDVMKVYRPYTAFVAFLGIFGGLIGAGLFIAVDMGNLQHGIYMMVTPTLTSPQVWDAAILGLYALTGMGLLWQCYEMVKGRRLKISAVLASLAVADGLLVIVTAFVLSLQAACPTWNNPAEPLSFLMSAIVAAMAVIILSFHHIDYVGYCKIDSKLLHPLGIAVAVLLVGEIILVIDEVCIGLYVPGSEDGKIIAWLLNGKGAAFFWLEILLLLLGTGLSLSEKKRRIGAGIALLAIVLVKYNLLQAQQLNPLLLLAGPSTYNPLMLRAYVPSVVELGTAVGILAFVYLVGILGLSKFRHLFIPARGE